MGAGGKLLKMRRVLAAGCLDNGLKLRSRSLGRHAPRVLQSDVILQ